MNHDGIFWVGEVGTSDDRYVVINKNNAHDDVYPNMLACGLTFDEAEALVLSMGYELDYEFPHVDSILYRRSHEP